MGFMINRIGDEYIDVWVSVDVENYLDMYITNISSLNCRVEIDEDKDVLIMDHEDSVMMCLPLSRRT